jgi:hypothetical protein
VFNILLYLNCLATIELVMEIAQIAGKQERLNN